MFKSLTARILLTLILAFAVLLPAVPTLAATNPFGKACNSNPANPSDQKPSESAICRTPPGKDPFTTKDGILHKATNFIAIIAGAAAVLVIAVAGFQLVASSGEAEKTAKAKKAILFALVGIVVIIFAKAIINFVIGKV